jgi:glutaminase
VSSRLQAALEALHAELTPLREGALAGYIPALAAADPEPFALAACTVEGQRLAAGDADRPFTLQSIANPFAYGLALEARGREVVLDHVDVEPSGNPFNAIVLDARSRRPPNPLVNAGAIAVAALQPGEEVTARFARVLERLGAFAGRALDVDGAVYASERATCDRNRAIAHLMRNLGMLPGDLEGALDLYTRTCAVRVDARDLALMAATLARDGVNPVTGRPALGQAHVRDVLSVMFTCGMNEFAGEWAYRVGLPAKSGVSGGLLAVVPGVLGLAFFSPRLDPRGNSVRGVRACERLAARAGLHVFDPLRDDPLLDELLG